VLAGKQSLELEVSTAMDVQAEELNEQSATPRASMKRLQNPKQCKKQGKAEQIDDLIWSPIGVFEEQSRPGGAGERDHAVPLDRRYNAV